MKALLAYCAIILLLVACSTNDTVIYGIGETHSRNFMGDGSTANTLLGNTYVAKNSTATKAIIQGIIGLTAAIYYGNLQLERETTQQLYNAGVTQVQAAQIKANLAEQLAKTGLAETTAKIAAGVPVK